MKVAIYVQHLLGAGHLVRMRCLAKALSDRNIDVTLITGGQPPAIPLTCQDFAVVQLPVIKTRAGDFSKLLDQYDNAIDDRFRNQRRQLLISSMVEFQPDILILETWPFGRRQMEFELIPLLDYLVALDKPPRIVSSIRDVLQVRAPKRRQQTLDYLERYVSLVLVHGDPSFIKLEQSFAEANQISCPLRYTGYIYDAVARTSPHHVADTDEILVSAGAGAAGHSLVETALDAARKDARSWRILAGSNPAPEWFAGLLKSADKRTTVEPNRPDFFDLLQRCAVSVSQCGYNTTLDLCNANCASVVVPYADDGETEQAMRAECFADRGLFEVIKTDALSSQQLLGAIGRVSAQHRSGLARPDMDGAAGTVDILQEYYP